MQELHVATILEKTSKYDLSNSKESTHRGVPLQ